MEDINQGKTMAAHTHSITLELQSKQEKSRSPGPIQSDVVTVWAQHQGIPEVRLELITMVRLSLRFRVRSTIHFGDRSSRGPVDHVMLQTTKMHPGLQMHLNQVMLNGETELPSELIARDEPYIFDYECRFQSGVQFCSTMTSAHPIFQIHFCNLFHNPQQTELLGEGSQIEILFSGPPRPKRGMKIQNPMLALAVIFVAGIYFCLKASLSNL